MPKLSELSPDQVEIVAPPKAPPGALKLSQLRPDAVEVLTKPKPEGIEDVVGSAMRGAAQGASLGFIDEATAGVGGLYDYVQGKIGSRGSISLSDAYKTRRDTIREADARAEAENPKAYFGGQITGALGTAMIPGAGALNAAKGASIATVAGKGAISGAIAGAGSARNLIDVPAETLKGAAVGGALGGAISGAGKVATALIEKMAPAKVASVLLNAPEEGINRYIKNPQGVNAARPRAEIVEKDFLPRIAKLKEEVTAGSQASRDILDAEGKSIKGGDIADIFDAKAQEIYKRSEGVFDDPQVAAAYNWLRGTAQKFRPKVNESFTDDLQSVLKREGFSEKDLAGMRDEVERTLSTNRVKDTVQSLQRRTEYQTEPGQMSRVDDRIRKDVAGKVNQLLKDTSGEYSKQMERVAADTRTLKSVADLAKTPQGFDSLLKRTQRGTAPHQLEALKAFDKRTGGGLIEELQNSATKEALSKSAMNGSRNVNLFGAAGDAAGEAIGGLPGKLIGRTVGLLHGATVDKYGPKMAKTIIDSAARMEKLMSTSQGLKDLGRYARPLIEAAQNGNQALAATHAYLAATDPTYRQILAEKNAIQRRTQTGFGAKLKKPDDGQ